MSERFVSSALFYGVIYFAIAGGVVFFHILPLQTVPSRWAAPDLMLGLTFAWLLRRPEYVPVLLIAAVFLIQDVFFQRPMGLYAALTVLGSEFLRSRNRFNHELSFMTEWVLVAGTMAAIVMGGRVLMFVVAAPAPALGMILGQLFLSILVYPIIVGLSYQVFGVRRIAPGDADAQGQKP